MLRVDLTTNPELIIQCTKCNWIGKALDIMPENPMAEQEGYCRNCGNLYFYEEGDKKENLIQKIIGGINGRSSV